MTERIGLSRRSLLRSGAAVAATTAVGAVLGAGLGAFPFKPALAVPAKPGEMIVTPGTPNPTGGLDQLYWVTGNPLAAPVTTLTGALPGPMLKAGESRTLRVFHFNDLHTHLTLPHKTKGPTHKFAQMVKIIDEARARRTADEVILTLSGGDDHTGSVFDELIGWSPEEFLIDPGYTAYSAAGVDMAALGNHELDRGTAVLREGLRQNARFPVLSSNLYGSHTIVWGQDYMPAAIGVRNGLRIAVIGLTTPVDSRVGTKDDPSLAVDSPAKALRNLLPALSAAADFTIVLSHCGYGLDSNHDGKAGADRTLVEGDLLLAEITADLAKSPAVVIGGHTHTVLNADGLESRNLIRGVPVLQAGGHGSHLGEAVFRIGPSGAVAAPSARLHTIKARDNRVPAGDPKAAGLETEADYDTAFEAQVIAPLLSRLDSRLAAVIGRIEGAPAIDEAAVQAERYVGECALANFLTDSVVERSSHFPGGGQVDAALFNATGLAAGLPTSGPVTFQQVYEVNPFADSILICQMTGRQILAMLTSNARRIVRPEELTAGGIDVTKYVSRGFLHFSAGLRYTIALGPSVMETTVPQASIGGVDLRANLDRLFRIGMNTYIAGGGYGEAWNGNPIGGGVPGQIASFDIRALPKLDTGLVYRNEVIARIRETGIIAPSTGARRDGRLQVIA